MDDSIIVQIVIAIIAIFGFCLSIYNLYIQRKDKNPLIKVTTQSSFTKIPGIGVTSPHLFTTTAMNIGHVPVHLSSCGIHLPNGKLLQFVGPDEYTFKSLPQTLQPGSSYDISRELEGIINDLKKEGYSGTITVQSYFRDEINNTYTSNDINFKISS
jgi:hypothetical protein